MTHPYKDPRRLPSSMAEVLSQRPDVPFDMRCPLCRFGHGLAYPALFTRREEAIVEFDVAAPDRPVPVGSGSPVPPTEELLALDGVSAGYGAAMVLHEVTVAVPRGTMVALLGANGAGKTTLLRVASGLLRPSAGEVRLGGAVVTGQPAHRRARGGLCLIPEGRGIFPSLTVRENLEIEIPPWVKDASLARALEVFPALGNRMRQVAGTLSGGEQQMLALARAVLAEPKVILVDEISMGLAPRLVDSLFEALTQLAAGGISMLIVEQYIQRALEICSLAYIMSKGTVVYSGPSQALQRDTVIRKYLGA